MKMKKLSKRLKQIKTKVYTKIKKTHGPPQWKWKMNQQ